eukprot:TRINITY_DN396_c0_g2_i1.p1 TRINITY_DN396_c0_g2~~TRINITY_DN396_c0_g2_i1.p1  ORF type:complete len:129 (-),score=39.05 TRINITY_DN396_c0_g2_i1:31-417(-)
MRYVVALKKLCPNCKMVRKRNRLFIDCTTVRKHRQAQFQGMGKVLKKKKLKFKAINFPKYDSILKRGYMWKPEMLSPPEILVDPNQLQAYIDMRIQQEKEEKERQLATGEAVESKESSEKKAPPSKKK